MNVIPSIEEIRNGKFEVVAAISGGKDSAAMSLFLADLGIKHRRVFFDTGWEHSKTYEYLRGELADKIGNVEEIKPPLQMEELIKNKGMFPSRVVRYCTQQLKVLPAKQYLAKILESGKTPINAVGIRSGESKSRSGLFEWEWEDDFQCFVWRPIIAWSEKQVIDYHAKHNLAPNPLYLMGASRVGCWPCIFARKAEIRLMAETDPDRVARIEHLEKMIGDASQTRHDKRGEVLKYRPTFFQANKLDENGEYLARPITDVVAWSKTSRGGNQFEMFSDNRDGCMRWGLCDTGEKK